MEKVDLLIIALMICKKYGRVNISQGHDVIYFGPDSIEKMEASDRQYLAELGVGIDNDSDSFYVFV